MSLLISDAYAQAPAAATASPYQMPILMVLMLGAMYFLLIRPQQKRAKEHTNMLSKLAAGDEVVTAGGILGRISDVSDGFVTVEIAEGVRIKVQKSQVSQLVPKGTYKSA
ncbi:MAG: preprotein translocase subunit YajC [Steroidobacteraceae bacterium]